MSTLADSRGKLLALIQEVEKTDMAYNHSRALYEALEGEQEVDLNGVGLNLVFDGGTAIPVPIPTDREQLLNLVERSTNFLGSEVVRLWNEIANVAYVAKQYCDAAAASAAQHQQVADPNQQQQPAPAAPTGPTAPPQPNQQQPRVRAVTTEPVGS